MIEGRQAWWRPRLDGLAPRVAAYLSIALLPLGLIALYQTREFQEETEERAELSLIALTEQGATGVEMSVRAALGAGGALALLEPLLDSPETCAGTLGRFTGPDAPYSMVALIPPEGPVTCSSGRASFEVADRPEFLSLREDPPSGPAVRPAATAEGRRLLVITVPVGAAGEEEPSPLVALSLPRGRIPEPAFGLPEFQPAHLVTFDSEGRILTSAGPTSDELLLSDLMPADLSLDFLATRKARAFEGTSATGEEQVYTVVPLVPGILFALGVWSPAQAGRGIGRLSDTPILFPLLMWATSLAVAFWAIHRLVIRRVAGLVTRMRRFGRNRSNPEPDSAPGTPFELREIEDAFRQMAHSIIQDEARMENAFRERGVLLREVHHRVKNNLQLISSIISMQIRRLPEPRVRAILRRLQDRVLTLASIYRSLYTSPDMGDINAAPVIRAIVEQELRAGQGQVDVTIDLEDIILDPDKVVPLAFLAAEAVSNALARSGSPEGRPSLSVALHREGDRATLRIANSLAATAADPKDLSSGLGQHLIQAFAAQIGCPVETEAGDRLYRLSVTFPAENGFAEVEPA